MTEGGHKEEYTYPDWSSDNLDWQCQIKWNIRDVRSLYSSISIIRNYGQVNQIDQKQKKGIWIILNNNYFQ